MDTMSNTGVYTSGDWQVRAGSEDAFVARWTEFLEFARASAPGFVSARLFRDATDACHFVSIGEWQSEATQAAWRGMPGFRREARRLPGALRAGPEQHLQAGQSSSLGRQAL